ncbi:MAG: hypothetical protein ACJ78Q_20710 [Chloroflexia bacterium]
MNKMRIGAIGCMLLLACAGLLAGCGSIFGSQPTSSPQAVPMDQRLLKLSAAPGSHELHDLAIAAVDFDPEFDSHKAFTGKPYNLLVAVENKGTGLESPLTVSLQLLARDSGRLLMESQHTVRMLSAGDVTVVRFPGHTPTPSQDVYLLSAQVESSPPDANTANNKKVLEIRMNHNN